MKKIIGLSQLNLEPDQENYLRECLEVGKCWFVVRKRWHFRCIQASGSTRAEVERTLKGWPGSTLVKIDGDKVFWPDKEKDLS